MPEMHSDKEVEMSDAMESLDKIIARVQQRIARANVTVARGRYESTLRAKGRKDVSEDMLFSLQELRSLMKSPGKASSW